MKKVFILAALGLVLCMSECALCAESPIQVTQPAYNNMRFFVYKPVNVPRDFYVTYDGYLVYKDAKGVWFYGSAEQGGVAKTDYVVGSVIPSVVKLKPYNTKISSVAPVLGTQAAQSTPPAEKRTSPPGTISFQRRGGETSTAAEPAKSTRMVYMPPSSGLELYSPSELSPNNPDWTQNSNFMAIGRWQKSIDRIGVTSSPIMPVAWKGEYPDVIYAWTGLQWRQLDAKSSHAKALSTLRRGIYDLNRYIRKVNMLRWTDDDTHVLSQYSVMWGYQWMGLIFLGRDY